MKTICKFKVAAAAQKFFKKTESMHNLLIAVFIIAYLIAMGFMQQRDDCINQAELEKHNLISKGQYKGNHVFNS
jgi:hypothetical protein